MDELRIFAPVWLSLAETCWNSQSISQLILFYLLFWYNIVIAVIFICIVEMMCDKCDNFLFFCFFHTLKYNLFFLFKTEVSNPGNPSGNSRILTLIDYLPLSVVLQKSFKNLHFIFGLRGKKNESLQQCNFFKGGGKYFFFLL